MTEVRRGEKEGLVRTGRQVPVQVSRQEVGLPSEVGEGRVDGDTRRALTRRRVVEGQAATSRWRNGPRDVGRRGPGTCRLP